MFNIYKAFVHSYCDGVSMLRTQLRYALAKYECLTELTNNRLWESLIRLLKDSNGLEKSHMAPGALVFSARRNYTSLNFRAHQNSYWLH